MERLKEAVEKARQERESLIGLTDNTVTLNRATVARPFAGAEENITYTHTKTIHVPDHVYKKKRVIAGYNDPTVIASYKLLRTQVLRRLKEFNWNTLAVTSPNAGEGKTLTSVNLAISLAREVNHTVLLVDLDLRRPNVASCFGYVPEHGLNDYLEYNISLTEILINPEIERLVVLPGREAITDSSEMLSSPKMVKLVEEIKTRYPSRLIIFDMPPMLVADDVLTFSSYVDAFLVVIEEGKTKRDELMKAVDLLSNNNVLGTVLNKSVESVDNYY
jgi:protein-tyrosine kinase